MDQSHRIETLRWEGEGFKPLVAYGDWLVALMNWELRFDLSAFGKVERHNDTDEVFVLINGKSVLFVDTGSEIQAVDMKPGLVYNVPKCTWHSVIGNRDTTWLIVESNNTSSENTEHRSLDAPEMSALRLQFPDWLK